MKEEINIKFKTSKDDSGSHLHLIVETSDVGQRVDYLCPIEGMEATDDDKITILNNFIDEKVVNIDEVNKIARDMLTKLEVERMSQALHAIRRAIQNI